MYEYFRGNPHGRNPLEMLRDREPLPAHYMDRDARVSVIERQGLEGCGCSRRSACSTRSCSSTTPRRS
jgi:hypothetical protein